jgi:hypothetical protein
MVGQINNGLTFKKKLNSLSILICFGLESKTTYQPNEDSRIYNYIIAFEADTVFYQTKILNPCLC